MPRVFNSFSYMHSLPIPFSPSLKIASYKFHLFFFLFFLLVKTEFQGTWDAGSFLMGKQAWVVQKVKTVRVSWKSWMCLTDFSHKIPNSGLGPLFWSIQERAGCGKKSCSPGGLRWAEAWLLLLPTVPASATFPSCFPAVFSTLSPVKHLEHAYQALWSVLLSCNFQWIYK